MPVTVEFSEVVSKAILKFLTVFAADYIEIQRKELEKIFNQGLKELADRGNKSAQDLYQSNQTIRLVCKDEEEGKNLLEKHKVHFPQDADVLAFAGGPAVTIGDFEKDGTPRQGGTARIIVDNNLLERSSLFGEFGSIEGSTKYWYLLVHELLHAANKNNIHKNQEGMEEFNQWSNDFLEVIEGPKRKDGKKDKDTQDRRVGALPDFFRNPGMVWTAVLFSLIGITTCSLLVISWVNYFNFGDPISFWVANSGGTFLCPNLALADQIDLGGVGDVTSPEEGVLPIGDEDGSPIDEGVIDTDHLVIASSTDAATGVITEWIDMDGDGRPDSIRTYDGEGHLIEEREVKGGDVGEVIGQSVNQTTDTTTNWVDTDADGQPDVELQCDADGITLVQRNVQVGIMGFLASLLTATWLPIYGGILLSIGIMGSLIFRELKTWIYDFGEEYDYDFEDEEEAEAGDIYEKLKKYLLSLHIGKVREIILAIAAYSRTWKGGGGIALVGREVFIARCKEATAMANKEEMIASFIEVLKTLFDGLEAMVIFSFGLEFAFGLLATQLPAAITSGLGLLKLFAEVANLKKLLEAIKLVEKIKDFQERTEKLKELMEMQNEIDLIRGQIPRVESIGSASTGEAETSTVALAGTGSLIAVVRGFLTAPVSMLRGCSPIAVIFGLMGLLGFFAIVLYALFGGFQATGTPVETAPIVEEVGPAASVGDESEIKEVPHTPVPTEASISQDERDQVPHLEAPIENGDSIIPRSRPGDPKNNRGDDDYD